MRKKLLETLGRWAGEKTWWMLLAIIIITVISGWMAGQLEMSMSLTSLLPGDDPMVKEFNYISEEFNGASTIFIIVQGEADDIITFAEYISPRIKNLEPWITESGSDEVKAEHNKAMDKVNAGKIEYPGYYIERVDFKLPVEFIRDHGIMLIKPSDLKNTREVFTDPNFLPFLTNLNNSLEKEYIQSDEKISTTQREQSAVQFLDGIESWVDYTRKGLYNDPYNSQYAFAAAEVVSVGNPYFISPDRTMLLIMAEPTFGVMEMDFVMPCINGIEELIKTEAKQYNVEAGLTGGIVIGRDEMVAGMEDSNLLTILALIAVLILFIVTFKMLSAPILAILNLIIGIIWAMGVSWLLVRTLNMMTAMTSVVLVGLGIDFSIHIISLFSEFVNKGASPKQAIIDTLKKAGTGIITGGLTTAAAFLTLMIARSDGIFELGLVCGVGLIMIMIATLFTMPTMLMLRERYRSWRGKKIVKTRDVSYAAVGNIGEKVHKKWQFSILTIFFVTIFFGYMISKVTMDYNYLNMEPEGLESIILNEKVIEKFNFSSDITMMTAKSLEENQRFTKEAKEKSSISFVESVTEFLPIESEQIIRKSGIISIYNEMKNKEVSPEITKDEWLKVQEELKRLEMNVIELQDMAYIGGQDKINDKTSRLIGDPDKPDIQGNLSDFIHYLNNNPVPIKKISKFNRDFGTQYQKIVLDMADTARIVQSMLPEMIKAKYISKKGDRYLLTLYPKGNVWSIDYLETFTNEVLDISPSICGMPPMFYYLLKIIGADGKRAIMLTIVVVFLFLWADFRSIRFAIIAMLPLLFGMIWMVGFMGLTGIQLTLLNIMALPLIIGIGIDDGVHILHRYRIEGKDGINSVYRSTGKAVIITSLTTMIAFGSLVFATYRGFGSMGLALFIGVGMCLFASIFVLPAVLAVADRRKKKCNSSPRKNTEYHRKNTK